MAPKYRGGDDEFLDDQKYTNRKSHKPKRPPNKAETLATEEANATVAEVFPNQCKIRWDSDHVEMLAVYRRSTVLKRGETVRERAPVAVGDRVKAERVGDTAIIAGVCERKNRLLRPAPDRKETVVHVIVANIDRLAIVASAINPDFSPGLVDRILVAASAQGIEPVLVVNKIDLWREQGAGRAEPWQIYRDLGYPVHELSAKAGTGTEALSRELEGRSVAFCGHSGVGKTSLLSRLIGTSVGAEGEVSAFTGKGRHTTTSAVLLRGPGQGTLWIDTPGVREFGLADVKHEELKMHFPELADPRTLGCASEACSHREEEGCRARELPRYGSYRRILESLLSGEC